MGHGSLDLRGALEQSCDVYFYEVAKRTGIDQITATANRLGLGKTLGIDLPNERAGLLPDRDWKMAITGTPWQIGETLIAGIGQGYVLATPLQLAVMTARVANGGYAVKPRLTKTTTKPGDQELESAGSYEDMGLLPAHLQVVREGMTRVVNGLRGTARSAAIDEPGMGMAGKTGTSQVRRITKAEREAGVFKNEDLPWERRDHALFVGYAPVDAPRYAVAVIVEHGGGGSKVAAPIARDILIAAQRLDALRLASGERNTEDAVSAAPPSGGI